MAVGSEAVEVEALTQEGEEALALVPAFGPGAERALDTERRLREREGTEPGLVAEQTWQGL